MPATPGYSRIYPEIPVFLLYFSWSCCKIITSNFIIYRTCYVSLGHNETDCVLLGTKHVENNTVYLEKTVQPLATHIIMIETLAELLMPSVLSLFLGPWSDKFGRKPVLLSTLAGYTLAYACVSLITLWDVSPWFILLCNSPSYLLGGRPIYLAITYCYITDVTDEGSRGIRMSLCDASLIGGLLFGNLLSSYMLDGTGYFGVYAINATFAFLSCTYVLFFMPESVKNPETKKKMRNLFKLSLVKDMAKATFRKRQYYERCVLLTAILIAFLFALGFNGDINMKFFYLREKLHWSLQQFTVIFAGFKFTWVLATISGVYLLHKLLRVGEAIIIACGLTSLFFSTVLQGLATEDWHVYVVGFVRSSGGFVNPMIRFLTSKIIGTEETGKVFVLTQALESLAGVLALPIFTYIYNATLYTFSGFYNFVIAGIYGIAAMFTLALYVIQRCHPKVKYTEINS